MAEAPKFIKPASMTTVLNAIKTDSHTLPSLVALTLALMGVGAGGELLHHFGYLTDVSFDQPALFAGFLASLTVITLVVRGLIAHFVLLWSAVTIETVVGTINLNLADGVDVSTLVDKPKGGLSASAVERHLGA